MTAWKALDVPPVWLLGFIGLAVLQGRWAGFGLSLDHPVTQLLAGLLVGGGVVLMLLAVLAFRRHRTSVVPHRVPEHMITDGVFKRSRNPIYLGDVILLAGVILWLDAVASLVLLPVFVWVLTVRFILPEEKRLRLKFRDAFARYAQKTPRWF